VSDVKFDLSDHADVMATWLEGQPDIPPGVVNTLRDLAAEVRALRKDRDEIRSLARQYEADPVTASDRPSSWGKLQALVDAAMAREGEA